MCLKKHCRNAEDPGTAIRGQLSGAGRHYTGWWKAERADRGGGQGRCYGAGRMADQAWEGQEQWRRPQPFPLMWRGLHLHKWCHWCQSEWPHWGCLDFTWGKGMQPSAGLLLGSGCEFNKHRSLITSAFLVNKQQQKRHSYSGVCEWVSECVCVIFSVLGFTLHHPNLHSAQLVQQNNFLTAQS